MNAAFPDNNFYVRDDADRYDARRSQPRSALNGHRTNNDDHLRVHVGDPGRRSRAGPREVAMPMEKRSLVAPGPVKLTPSWEEKNLPKDQLNFKHMTLEDASSAKAPPDRCYAVYFILCLHGMGILMPWNMFITATAYFSEYKLNVTMEGGASEYRDNFLSYIGLASQIPSLIFTWLNVFVPLGGDLTVRVVVSILIEVVVFINTIVLAMVDSSSWPVIFFWVTMVSVVILNMASGVYQNSVYGIAAKLPTNYMNAVVIGSNLSGVLVSVINIASIAVAPSLRTAAIYYFITALFVLLMCFDTYFALPLMRFYRYYDKKTGKLADAKSGSRPRTPYWRIFRNSFCQLLNIFLVFFVTLTLFPNVTAAVKAYDRDFPIPEKYYTPVMCFLTFNVFAMSGSLLTFLIRKPGPRWLCIPVWFRLLLIPCFLFCNYLPEGRTRVLPVLVSNDWAFFGLVLFMGLSSGYLSSLGMMYVSGCVEPQYSAVAGMMGGVAIVTGVVSGLQFSLSLPWIIENVTFYI